MADPEQPVPRGVWSDPGPDAQGEARSAIGPVLAEVGGEYTRGERDAYAAEVAPQCDEVLLLHGAGDLRLYERLLRDDQVHTGFQSRRTAVTAMPLRVEPGGDRPIDVEAADDLRSQLEAMPFDRASYKMLTGLLYGYAVGELLYRVEDLRIRMDAIKVRKSRRFRFTVGGQILMVSPRQEIMPPQKFWTFTAGADSDDDLHGVGLGHYLYWPVWFKRNAHRFWALWLEKRATGVPIGKGPVNMTSADETKILGILDAITNGGRLVVPKNVEVSLLEAVRDSGTDYNSFVAYWDRAIVKIILSQTMTTEDGSSLAQAQVHERVAGAVSRSDEALLMESFCRGPATWLTDWNFPGAATPIVYRDFDEAEDMKALAETDKTLFDMGWRPTADRIREIYGEGYEPTSAPAAPAVAVDPAQAAPGVAPPPDPVVAGSDWIDTEDGHRMRVTGVDGTRVLFVDLDDVVNPNRQYAWQRPFFIERCRPATPPAPAAPPAPAPPSSS